MERLRLDNLPLTARAAVVAGMLVALVLGGIWALRSVARLPAFLPFLRGAEDRVSEPWRILISVAIIVVVIGIPLFLLIVRNGQLTQAKEALRTREAEFRAFAEAGSDWMWQTDENHRLVRLFGGRHHDFEGEKPWIIGKRLEEIINPKQIVDNAKKWRLMHEDLDAHRPFRDFEIRVRPSCGEKVRYLSLSGVPAHDGDGAFIGYLGTTTDITERKEVELALRHSEARFSDFAASASDWFWETDDQLRFTFISGRFQETLGVPKSHVIGKTRQDMASPDELGKRSDAWSQHLEDLEQRRPFRNFEYEAIVSNGDRRVILSSGKPVFDHKGRFLGYRGCATDVTEYRRTERESLEYLRQFRLLADNLPILIAHFDSDWRILYINKTGALWYNQPRRELIGKLYSEVAGAELDVQADPARRRVIAGEAVHEENVTIYPDGKTRTIERLLLPAHTPGEPPRFHVMAIDVTEQRQLEEQLRQNLKMEALGNLTGGVAHDFNNLLLAIQGNLEFLREEPVEATLMPFVDNALRGVERAADLTRRLLAFSRRQPLAPRAVDVGRLVSEMEDLLRRTLEAYVEIRIEPGDAPAFALADPGQLENALLNLAINARDAMPDGGSVTLRVRRTDAVPPGDQDLAGEGNGATASPFICIEVEDTGAGMPENIREHVFEPFFTTKQVGHGTGLGLAMVHGFVTQSGGFAEIDSEPGAGTTVRLYLPTAETPSPAEPSSVAPARRLAGGGRALLVEDNEMVRAVTARHLSDLGYQAVAVAGPAEALAALDDDQPFDLLLTDLVTTGGGDGLDLAERARQTRPKIGVVLMSGYADFAESSARAETLKAQTIAKPFGRARLADAILAARRPEPGAQRSRLRAVG